VGSHRVLGIAVVSCLTGVLARSAAQDIPSSPPPGSDTVHAFELDNGLRVRVQVDRARPRVGIALGFGSGFADDPEGFAGLAHVAEHALFEGTVDWPEGDYWRLQQALGARQVNAWTGPAHTVFELEVPRTALDRALWVEARRTALVLDRLDEAGSRRAVDAVVDEGRERWAQQTLWPRLFGALFGADHFSARLDSFEVEHIDLEELRWFVQQHYTPANATLALVGDLDPEAARAIVQRHFGAWRGLPRAPPRPVTPTTPWQRTVTIERGEHVPRRMLMLGWRLPPAPSTEQLALEVLAEPIQRELQRSELSVLAIGVAEQGPASPAAFGLHVVLPVDLGVEEGAARVMRALHGTCADREDTRYATAAALSDARTQLLLQRDLFERRADRLATYPDTPWLHDRRALIAAYEALDAKTILELCRSWLLEPPHAELRVREKQGLER